MAAGRGEFFQSLLEGLKEKPVRPAPGARQPGRGRARPGPGGGLPGPGGGLPGPGGGLPGPGGGLPGPGRGLPGPGGGQTGGKRKKSRPKAAPSGPAHVCGKKHSCSAPRTKGRCKRSPPEENLLERLPSEVLMKILSYLDASSLSCISHVSKLLHRLSSDDIIWQKIYLSEFGGQTWKPKAAAVAAGDAALKADPVQVEVEERSAGQWKKKYYRAVAGQQINKWRRELRMASPYTGLPRQTEWVLRNLNVSWELTLCGVRGQEVTVEQSRAHFFESSVIVRWSGGNRLKFHQIRNIQLYGVRREPLWSHRDMKPGWRSLILKVDALPGRVIGKDRLIKLRLLQPGVIVGVWRGQDNVAFIMISLHFHQLVERSVLGSPVCPYSGPDDPPPADHSDPEFGLHGYTLHFVMHNTGSEIMSGHFRPLSCRPGQIRRGLVELRVINETTMSQHRSLSGSIKLPWQSEELEGSVENCCFITLTLLDEFLKPFWCVSSAAFAVRAEGLLFFHYSGEHSAMCFQNDDGMVRMKLVWLEEQKQFFLIKLTVYVSVHKVNKHFSTAYGSWERSPFAL